jgi:hypothetical protein
VHFGDRVSPKSPPRQTIPPNVKFFHFKKVTEVVVHRVVEFVSDQRRYEGRDSLDSVWANSNSLGHKYVDSPTLSKHGKSLLAQDVQTQLTLIHASFILIPFLDPLPC